MKSVKLISSAIIMLICFVSIAQERIITGIVSNNSGELLSGAGVYNTRSKRQIYADMNGNYSIKAQKGDLLQFSFVGYESQTKKIRKKNTINITLVNAHQELREATGYDQTKIKRFDIKKEESNIMALTAPTSSVQEPLYILNTILDSKQFSKINPNDIEEIKVLKGNEAKLIYGDKGSNGAVIITLKE